MRELLSNYGRGAILQASIACRRAYEDHSNYILHRRDNDRIILSCVGPPIRRGEFELGLCGFGVVRTTKPIDRSLDMRSFKIVERVDKSRERQFEIHINIREKPPTDRRCLRRGCRQETSSCNSLHEWQNDDP